MALAIAAGAADLSKGEVWSVRPVSVSLTGNGASIQNSAPVVVDQYLTPMNLGLYFKDSGSTTVFKVQYSLDDPFGSYATDYNTNGVWFDHASLVTLTANASGSQTTPVRAVRLVASASGTDTGTLTVVQAGAR